MRRRARRLTVSSPWSWPCCPPCLPCAAMKFLPLQLEPMARCRSPGRFCDGSTLNRLAQKLAVAHRGEADGGDPRADLWKHTYQTLVGEPDERLADRRATDVQLLGHRVFGQCVARTQFAADDLAMQIAVYLRRSHPPAVDAGDVVHRERSGCILVC